MPGLFQLAVGPSTNITLVVARHVFKVRARYQVFRLAIGTLQCFSRFKFADRCHERAGKVVSQHLVSNSSGATLSTGEPERRHGSALAANQNSIEHGSLQNSRASPTVVDRVGIRQSILEEVHIERRHSGFLSEDQFSDSAMGNLAVNSVLANFMRSQHTTGEQRSAIKC
ncbi:MAG: hypothetical protein ACI8P0_000214 [Planctomycetaceae bacterium]|jgi:hypothetical protein